MNDAAAFLRAIIAEPDADDHRVVYADYLEQHGDLARAEFVRVQCALASWPPCLRSHFRDEFEGGMCLECQGLTNPLRRRERELLKAVAGLDWLPVQTWAAIPDRDGRPIVRAWEQDGPLNTKLVYEATFTRGFVSSVTLSWADWATHAKQLLAAAPIARVNRPRACGACGGRRLRLPEATADLPCLKCRGKGTVDDWKGDGRVVLTSLPAIDVVRQTSNGYVQRIRGGRCGVETGYGEPYESVFLKATNAEYPGVWFGLPEPRGVDGLTAREVAERMNAAECEWEEVGPAAAVICQCHREPVRQGRDWDAAGPPRQVEVLRLESHAYHQAGDVYHVSVAQCPHCRRVHYTRPRRGASLVTGGRP